MSACLTRTDCTFSKSARSLGFNSSIAQAIFYFNSLYTHLLPSRKGCNFSSFSFLKKMQIETKKQSRVTFVQVLHRVALVRALRTNDVSVITFSSNIVRRTWKWKTCLSKSDLNSILIQFKCQNVIFWLISL